MDDLGNLIKQNKVLIFSASDCKDTEDVQNIFTSLHVTFNTILLDSVGENREELEKQIYRKATKKITPTVFVNGCQITGKRTIVRYLEDGSLRLMLNGRFPDYDYDLLVIGGGSAGIAAAREASQLGVAVALCDFVHPTSHGTTWGLGGTSVNVGSMPKKLMHMGAIIGADLEQASYYGWNVETKPFHNWNTLILELQNHIKSLNFGYRKSLKDCGVLYMNASAKFVNSHTLQTVDKYGKETMVKAKEFIIATGGKPANMKVPGAKYGITSSDIFSLPYYPGKVLIIGASYVGLECAGFLNSFGIDTTVCDNQKALVKFDQQMAGLIINHMSQQGVKFICDTVVDSIVKKTSGEPGTYEVTLTTKGGENIIEKYNTILIAVGRVPNTENLGLEQARVKINPDTGYILVNERDQTSVAHIYAVGDVCDGRRQLYPVAVQTAKCLARRLYGNEDTLVDHTFIPSTIFTPIEYGFIGLTEEEAVQQYGYGDVKIYHVKYVPPGLCLAPILECYGKIICIKSNDERVFGFHICGPNAGEITQGFALAMKLGAKKDDFLNMLPIHSVSASVFTNAYHKHISAPKEDKHRHRPKSKPKSKPSKK